MSRLSIDRQAQVLELLRKHGSLKIDQIAQEMDVSAMTIHRDLKKLDDGGLIHKVHGGATIREHVEQTSLIDTCNLCGAPISGRSTVIIRLTDNSQLKGCCPHCGIVLMESYDNITSTVITDFLLGQVVNIKKATFLLESELKTCCVPTILAFASPEDAVRFQRGFGGRLADFETARQLIKNSN